MSTSEDLEGRFDDVLVAAAEDIFGPGGPEPGTYVSPLPANPGASVPEPAPAPAPAPVQHPGVPPASPPGREVPPAPLADGTEPSKHVPYSRLKEVVDERNSLREAIGQMAKDPRFVDYLGTIMPEGRAPQPQPQPQVAPAPMPAPPQAPPALAPPPIEQDDPDEDPATWFHRNTQAAMAPVVSQLAEATKLFTDYVGEQRGETRAADFRTQFDHFEQSHPLYDRQADSGAIMAVLQANRASNFEDAYALACPQKRAAEVAHQAQPAPAIHDPNTSGPQAPGDAEQNAMQAMLGAATQVGREDAAAAVLYERLEKGGIFKQLGWE